MYTAKYILQQLPECRVHIIERLPVPFGLVRHGIAPDHPEAKAVINDFTKSVLNDPRTTLLCNMEVGVDVSLSALQSAYHAVILAVGASASRTLGIPGEDYPGVTDAREIVSWYNGHPDHSCEPPLAKARRAVIVGNGNVSLDVARILLAPPALLAQTDIPLAARALLDAHPVSAVHICARKPLTGAAWTIAELREIITLTTANGGAVQDTLSIDPSTGNWRAGAPREYRYYLHLHRAEAAADDPAMAQRPVKRKTELVLKTEGPNVFRWPTHAGGEALPHGLVDGKLHRHLHLHFEATPAAITRANPDAPCVDGLEVSSPDGVEHVPAAGVDAGRVLVVKSIGYRTESVGEAPLDEQRHVIPTEQGRVRGMERVYAVGWASRGPTGIVGTHIGEARAVSNGICADVASATPSQTVGAVWSAVHKPVVDLEGWERIAAAERAAGADLGVEGREGLDGSVKLSTWEALLAASRRQ
jgi:hypothetical protein